jgi:hypothetical protein
MYAGKAGAYPSEALGLTHKHKTKLGRLARGKHFSLLLRKSVNYGGKFFYRISPTELFQMNIEKKRG